MSESMNVLLDHKLKSASLAYWKLARQDLLRAMSQVTRISPFNDENPEFGDPELINIFCKQLLAYLTNNYGNVFQADKPAEILLIKNLLTSTQRLLVFYDKYTNTHELAHDHAELIADLTILSEDLALHLDLEELLIANY